MTNEEKAQKIIGGGCNRQDCYECGGGLSVAEGCVEFKHLMEMAEWKERQMIEKACKWLKDDMLNQNAFQGRLERLEIIDGIIERFKTAMEE